VILNAFSEDKPIANTELVLPTSGWFEFDPDSELNKAEQMYRQTAEYCGIADWPVKIVEFGDHGPVPIADLGTIESGNSAAGTFVISTEDEIQIGYSASIKDYPHRLIATFAHEIAHYIIRAFSPVSDLVEDSV
jgi:hypothetical protein